MQLNKVMPTLKAACGTIACTLLAMLSGCHTLTQQTPALQQTTSVSFKLHTGAQTGLQFTNKLTPNAQFNMFNYMYFYNGAGVGVADFNADGLPDVFLASNQGGNALYLNQGGLRFTDVTTAAQIPNDGGWHTGVSVVDINNDSLPDIYVCRVAGYEALQGANQLLVCQGLRNGVPWYKEEAAAYGLNFAGFSTQAAFFDMDKDGDLDMFLLNHATDHAGRFDERSRFLNTYDAQSGDQLYRNDNGRFTNITRQSGIHSSAIGYGLGVCIADINQDGWPDIYVGNDFHENDYLYINNGKGGFVDEITLRTMHTSQFSMGVDIADINNDALPEILSMDMLPADYYMLKRSLGEDSYDIFDMKLRYGYHPYFTRNNLQLNRGNQLFSEIGLYSGIAATDWSWACLWMDFDNNGWKDLFVSNGIPKRLNDIDYVTFITDERMQQKIINKTLTDSDFAVINKFPEIKLPNYFFENKGQARFVPVNHAIQQSLPTFSNGAAYADLDNDGDLDLVVNNIDDACMVYENTLDTPLARQYCKINLRGPGTNVAGIGARVLLYYGTERRLYEQQPVRGFMSSMLTPIHIGLGAGLPDSAVIIWPDDRAERFAPKAGQAITLQWTPRLPKLPANWLTQPVQNVYQFKDITQATGIIYDHTENIFQEFNREQLLPHMLSTEGPALAVGDVNADGLEDVFIGAARGFKPALFVQQRNGRFVQSLQPALDADSAYEDIEALWADMNGDGLADLVVASGGNEFYGTTPERQPRLYLNQGGGILQKKPDAFNDVYLTAGALAAHDADNDGYLDLFIGARAEPFKYGITPRSYLLRNNGQASFTDATEALAPGLSAAGMVKHALWYDIDGNGQKDLLLSCQWQAPCAWLANGKSYQRQWLADATGWWNFLLPMDANADGLVDLIAGNQGLNNRFSASPQQPLRLYVSDFDGNGTTEQVMTYYLNGQEVPFANKDELQKQMPGIKKRFLYAADFAKAGLRDVFTEATLNKATVLQATQLANGLLMNKGNMQFAFEPINWLAQVSTYRHGVVVKANADSLPDILLVGNFFDNNIQMGRNDADFGTLLINKGKGNFEPVALPAVILAGESRRIEGISIGGKQSLIVARNNAPVVVMRIDD
mgnify:CR=1 FL=1